MNEIRVRPMEPADIDAVMALADSLDTAPHWTRDMYAFMMEPAIVPLRVALVAETSGAVVGFAAAGHVAPEANLDSIAVAAALQRRGVARALLCALSEALSERGVTEILLEVRASNLPAQAFYHTMGFEEQSRRRKYYSSPVEDAVLMQAILSLARK
jgi:ribosomal-protein-alanine N-acetyltransferase